MGKKRGMNVHLFYYLILIKVTYTFIVTNRLLEEAYLKEVIEEKTDKKVVTNKITDEIHLQNYAPRLIIYTATLYN